MPAPAKLGALIAAIIVPVAMALAAYSIMRSDPLGTKRAELPPRFKLDLSQQVEVPSIVIGYIQRTSFPLTLQQPRAIAVGSDDAIYVAGDQAIQVIESNGSARGHVQLEVEPTCLAVSGDENEEPGRMYIGTAQGVLIYGPDGVAQGAWPSLGEQSILTSIGLAQNEVFVADAGHRLVLRYGAEGQLLGRIGAESRDRKMPGFVIPSPYFDLVVGTDMLLYVVNPGARRIECYTFDGQLQAYWGKAGSDLVDFFGCCNPAHLARMADGRFVTSEKGIPRVKIYSAHGDFETVVAGPAELGVQVTALGDARSDQSERVFDIAVNRQGEVLVLDARNRCVRVFVPKESDTGKEVKNVAQDDQGKQSSGKLEEDDR